jgi:transposase
MSRPGPKLPPVILSDEERAELERWTRRRTTAQALATRARIVLACAQESGDAPTPSIGEVVERTGVSRPTVATWRTRFLADRLDGLSDAERPGRPRTIDDARVEEVIVKTLEHAPPNRDSHWSTRSMARATGMSQSAIARIWRAVGLTPHLAETGRLSTDPFFLAKVRDVVGLYLDPPERALVLCVERRPHALRVDQVSR